MAICSSILPWKISQTGEPGGLQSMRLQRVRQLSTHTNIHTISALVLNIFIYIPVLSITFILLYSAALLSISYISKIGGILYLRVFPISIFQLRKKDSFDVVWQ